MQGSSNQNIAYFNFGSDFLGLIDSPTIQANRLSCIDENLSMVVNGKTLTMLDLNCDVIDSSTVEGVPDDGNVVKHSFAHPSRKVSIDIPEMKAKSSFQGCCRVSAELAYAVDSRTGVVVARANSFSGHWACSYIKSDRAPFSGGFAAIASIDGTNTATTCHYLSKQLQWMDVSNGHSIRTCGSLFNPTAIAAVGGTGQVAITEGRCLSTWDHRMKENGITYSIHYSVYAIAPFY